MMTGEATRARQGEQGWYSWRQRNKRVGISSITKGIYSLYNKVYSPSAAFMGVKD